MKKILIINTAGLSTGGITTHMLNYLSNINRETAQIDLVSTVIEDSISLESFKKIGCRIFKLPHRMRDVFSYTKALNVLLKTSQYDVVHVHGSSCTIFLELFLAKSQGVNICIAHSHNSTCPHKFIHYFFKPIMKYYYTKAFACSSQAGKWMFGNAPFEILHNVFNYKKFLFSSPVRANKRKELGLKEEHVAFCVVGNLVEQKNQIFALNLFSSLNIANSKLYIVGDGPLKSYLQENASGMDNIVFMGSRSDVFELLQAFDFYLMPSKWEGLPVALLEAQASGIACIVSDYITKEAMLCNDTQFVSLDNPKLWKKAISEINITDESRQRRSDAAKSILSKDYNMDIEFLKLKNAYQLNNISISI